MHAFKYSTAFIFKVHYLLVVCVSNVINVDRDKGHLGVGDTKVGTPQVQMNWF